MKKTKKLVFSAILSALAVVFMYIGALFDVLDLSVAALASMCVALVLVELGARWAFLVYAVVSVLSFLLLPAKTPAILFCGFLGFYPIAKSVFERRLHGALQWLLKLILLNICVGVMLLVLRLFTVSTAWFEALTLVLANFVFIVYDIALSRLLRAYVFAWRKKLKISF